MILLRHGESEWNAGYRETKSDPDIRDAPLTRKGRRQAAKAARTLRRRHKEMSRIVASPYRRSLETAGIITGHLKLPVRVEPLVAERAFFSCDVGSPRSKLARDWPHIDFDQLAEQWWVELKESEDSLLARCAAFRSAWAESPDWQNVVVVSHWGFIKGLTGEDTANGEFVRFDPTAEPVAREARLGLPASGA